MRQNTQLAVVGGRDAPESGALKRDADAGQSMRNEISTIFEEVLGRPVVIEDDTDIVEDLGMDSLGVMNFVMAIEDFYDISIPLDRIAQIRTVADLIHTVDDLRKGSAA